MVRWCRWFYETKAAWQWWSGGWVGVRRRWGVPRTVQLRARATAGEERLRVAGVWRW